MPLRKCQYKTICQIQKHRFFHEIYDFIFFVDHQKDHNLPHYSVLICYPKRGQILFYSYVQVLVSEVHKPKQNGPSNISQHLKGQGVAYYPTACTCL